MKFSYPTELNEHLEKYWQNVDTEGRQAPPLPEDKEQLSKFLEIAYHASMLTEEQRQIGFRLALISREMVHTLAGPEELGRLFEPVEFINPREFSVREILRLAPATDHTKVIICVSPGEEGEDGNGGQLQIWGLLDTGSSWWDFTHGQSGSGTPPPNCLTVSSIEPGNLTFSREGSVLFSLKRGGIVIPSKQTLYQGPIAEFLDNGIEALYEDTRNSLGDENRDLLKLLGEYPRELYFRYIERLLFQIREEHHGGALIVVPDGVDSSDPELSKLVMVKYPCRFKNVWPLHVLSLALRCRYKKLYMDLYRGRTEIPIEKHHDLSSLAQQREMVERRISDSVKLIASTSQVDGAVIISDRFQLIGFGSEITVNAPGLREVHLAVDPMAHTPTTVPIESYGTRHRSAFRFCWENENSVAFVVSMDGGVKGVKRVGDKLAFWPDINFGPLGI